MRLFFGLVIIGALLGSCKSVHQGPGSDLASTFEPPATQGKGGLAMCYGYRGNGSSVFATIGGIARFFDQYKAPDAITGTSSGSVAAFITESVMVPNSVYECAGCSPEDVNERRSFMLKAFPLFVNALVKSDNMAYDYANIQEAVKIYRLVMSIFFNSRPGETKSEAKPLSIGDNPILNSQQFQSVLSFSALQVLKFSSREVKDMISPDFYKVSGIGGKANPGLIKKSVDNLLNFQGITKENKFQKQNLMYPGVVNFDYIFRVVGTVADWYAGYGTQFPEKDLNDLLDNCSKNTRGLWWNDIAAKKYGSGDCGTEYFKLFSTYFNARHKDKNPGKQRVEEVMGAYVPAFVSTSAIGGNEEVAQMSKLADAGDFESIDTIVLKRANFKVLYFGPESFKEVIKRNKKMYSDVITDNIVSMGALRWIDAMKASGQEPATARAGLHELDGQSYLATGGFVDQLQSKVQRMIGCESTVALNNNKPIFDFANRFAPRIWDDPALVHDLFETKDPNSSESEGFRQTDALLCSRWGSYGIREIWEMADNSYHQIIYTKKFGLLDNTGIFKRKDGTRTTENSDPISCYAQEDAKNNQFPAYKVDGAPAEPPTP